jgi:hypothetical protein
LKKQEIEKKEMLKRQRILEEERMKQKNSIYIKRQKALDLIQSDINEWNENYSLLIKMYNSGIDMEKPLKPHKIKTNI